MEAIYIPRLLKIPGKTEEIQLQDFLENLETLTPVRGTVRVTHRTTYLEVQVQAEAIVTLTCHRCLQQYNYRLGLETTEIIWLEENAQQLDLLPLEREVKLQDLSETLSPQGYFYLDLWLYEQFSLAMPLRQLCDQNCQGVTLDQESDNPLVDSRWAALATLASSTESSPQIQQDEEECEQTQEKSR